MAPTKSGPFRAEGGCTGSSSRETQPSARGGRGWFGSPCLVSGLIIPFLVPAAGMPPNESQDPRSSDVPPSKSRSGGHLARVLPWHWNLRGSPWLSTHLPCSSGPPCLLRPFSVLGGIAGRLAEAATGLYCTDEPVRPETCQCGPVCPPQGRRDGCDHIPHPEPSAKAPAAIGFTPCPLHPDASLRRRGECIGTSSLSGKGSGFERGSGAWTRSVSREIFASGAHSYFHQVGEVQPDCVRKQVEESVVSETSSARLSQLNLSLGVGAGVDTGPLHETAPRPLSPCCRGVLDADSFRGGGAGMQGEAEPNRHRRDGLEDHRVPHLA